MKKINIQKLTKGEKGYLLGLFAGDGNLHHDKWRHYRINFYLNPKKDQDIADYLIYLLKKIELPPYIMFHHGCLIVRLNSKAFYYYLKEKYELISTEKNTQFMKGFISGFIDSDGYVEKGDIVISNKCKTLLELTESFCKTMDIYTKLWNQKFLRNDKIYTVWRLRIGTTFKYKQQYSRKILRIYGGGFKKRLPNHSERPSSLVVPIRVG